MTIYVDQMPRTQSIEMTGLAREFPKDAWIEPHTHDAHQVVHARAGIMRVFSPGGVWVVPPGRALWVPADTEHSILCVSAVSMRTVYLEGQHNAFAAECVVWNVSPLMRELIIRVAADDCRGQEEHLLALLMFEIDRIDAVPLHLPEPTDGRIKSMTDALLAQPDDTQTLDDWAAHLGMSPRTLIRRFQKETGLTFRQWRQQARLLAALERLAAGQAVTSVALEVGYESPSAFVAAFREALGVTPGKYMTGDTAR
jgi:AraC-like DNA-binding protein